MDRDYALIYPELYRTHWWWRAREEFVFTFLREKLAGRGPQRILDVGCAGGLFFDRLSQLGEVEGVEVDESMRTGDVAIDSRIHWGPLETMPPGRRYTVVLLLDVLEHAAEPGILLSRVSRVLAPHGLLLVTVPAFQILWTSHDEINHHWRRYTKESIQTVASSAGFRTVALAYFFHWTFGAKLLLRGLERRKGNQGGRSKLPSIPANPINRALFLLSRLEQRAGLWHYCPFGSSLLFLGTYEASVTP